MAKHKFYAVKKGNVVGIFESWPECEFACKGYSGAEFKGFPTREEAEAYLNDENIYLKQIREDIENGYVVAYTDGSYDEKTNEYAYGVCIIDGEGNEFELCSKVSHKPFASSRNIAGEIFGVLTALDWAVSNGYEKIKIYHDLESVSKWATGEYTANSEIAKYYVKILSQRFNECIKYEFVKVQGHSNNPYNDKADRLAASAFAGERKIIEGANSFAVTSLKREDLETIIELIKEEYNEISEERKDILGGQQIKLKISKKIYTTIKFYNSNKVLVQGKPNVLYQMVLTYVSELLGNESIVQLVKQAYRIRIDKNILEANYENLCANIPESYNENIKTLIRQAIINLNSFFDAEDYGQYAFPALKALEGHIKFLLNKHGVLVNKRFEQFDGNAQEGFVLKDCIGIPEPDKTNLGKCYTFYNINRHRVFHFGDIIGSTDNTYMVMRKEEANDIIKAAISLINNTVNL